MCAIVLTSPFTTVTCVPPLIARERTPGIAGEDGGRRAKIVYAWANWSPATAVTATLNWPRPRARANVNVKDGLPMLTWTERTGSHDTHEAPDGNGVTIDATYGRGLNVQSERLPVSVQLGVPV